VRFNALQQRNKQHKMKEEPEQYLKKMRKSEETNKEINNIK